MSYSTENITLCWTKLRTNCKTVKSLYTISCDAPYSERERSPSKLKVRTANLQRNQRMEAPPARPLPTAHCCSPLRAESQLSPSVPSQAGDEVSVLYWLKKGHEILPFCVRLPRGSPVPIQEIAQGPPPSQARKESDRPLPNPTLSQPKIPHFRFRPAGLCRLPSRPNFAWGAHSCPKCLIIESLGRSVTCP